MSKILDATCNPTGVVTADGVAVPAATVLSKGKAQSTGLLFLEADKARYLPSNAPDVESTISDTIDALDAIGPALSEIALALTAIAANMSGSSTSPPASIPTSVATINAKVTLITTAKTKLTTLKGALI